MSPKEEQQGLGQTIEPRQGLGELALAWGSRALAVGMWQISVPSGPLGER